MNLDIPHSSTRRGGIPAAPYVRRTSAALTADSAAGMPPFLTMFPFNLRAIKLAVVLLGVAPTVASAAITTLEHFDAANAADVVGQGSSDSGWASVWAAGPASSVTAVVDSTVVEFTPMGANKVGGTKSLGIAGTGTGVPATRQLFTARTGTFYVGCLMKFSGILNTEDIFTVGFGGSATDTANGFNFGLRGVTTGPAHHFFIRRGTGTPSGGPLMSATGSTTDTRYLVLKVQKTAAGNYDKITGWINPHTMSEAMTPNGDMQLLEDLGVASLSHLILRASGVDAGDSCGLDHLVLGTTFADTVPPFFGIFPLYGSYSGNAGTLTEAQALAAVGDLKTQIGENRGQFRVGFGGIYGGESTLDRNCRLARDNNLSHSVIIGTQTHALPTNIKNIAAADFRYYQWRRDGVTWEGVDSADNRDWQVVTPSRYATALRTQFATNVSNTTKAIKRQMDAYPGVIVNVNACIEEELATGTGASTYMGDYSPYAITEFRDWLRHTGIYDADTGTYPTEGAPAAIVGTFVTISGKLRSPFYDDPTPGSSNGTGATFNATFLTTFTTWTLKNWDLTAYPSAITSTTFNPAPTSGSGFTSGGFDAPRTVTAGNAFWRAWSWDWLDQGSTYPAGNPAAPAFGFRQVMVRNFVNDLLAWVQAEGIPANLITAHQIPGEMLTDANRSRTAATPIWTGLSKHNGTVGITRYGTFNTTTLGYLTQYTDFWSIHEWHPRQGETDNTVLRTYAMNEIEKLYNNKCRLVQPFSWTGSATYPVKNSGIAVGLKDWMDAKIVTQTPTITSIADQNVSMNMPTSVLPFAVGDDVIPAGSIVVTAASSNLTLVPTANIVITGTGANRSVTVTPASGQTGSATITLTASDGSLTSATSFLLTVSAVSGDRIKAATGTVLNVGSAWTGGVVPQTLDTATWNSTSLVGALTLGANLNWAGLIIQDPAGPVTVSGANTLTLGATGINMASATANLMLNHPVIMSGAQPWSVNSGLVLTATGTISGTGTLTKSGAGILVLGGSNTFTGAVTVSSGPLRIKHSNALGTAAKSIALSNGTSGQCQLLLDGIAGNIALPAALTLNTSMQTLTGAIVNEAGSNSIAGPINMIAGGGNTLITVQGGSLALNGAITANATSARALVLAGTGSNAVNGAISDGTTTAAVTVQGGTWTLSAPNTYTGATAVNSGATLNLTGSLTSAVTITSSTLSGNGSVAGNITLTSGTHAPGNNAAGVMALSGNYALNSSATLQVEINGSTVGTQYDQVKLTGAAGTVTLGGALNITAAPGLTGGTIFTLIDNTGPAAVSGTFAGRAQGSTFTASGYTWTISYTGGNGNDVTLTLATPQQAWRFAHFGTTANTGNAADTFDSNNDGENNLLEFATGQNPGATTLTATPLVRNGANLDFTYTRSIAAMADGVTFSVRWSDTLVANSWSTLGVTESLQTDNGTVQTVKATVPIGTNLRRFVRLQVAQP